MKDVLIAEAKLVYPVDSAMSVYPRSRAVTNYQRLSAGRWQQIMGLPYGFNALAASDTLLIC